MALYRLKIAFLMLPCQVTPVDNSAKYLQKKIVQMSLIIHVKCYMLRETICFNPADLGFM